MFELTPQPIDPVALLARVQRPDAGAVVVFEGRVRNHHLGRAVTHLEYEAFDELAVSEGATIVAETETLHPGAHVLCVHRTGSLPVGELAVWIGVASAHRHAGFAACRHVIEELKRRLPIWKKEHHPDGAAEWVNCTTEALARNGGDDYHARQVSLPEVGPAGQAKLAAARVLIVGLGGLGCPAAAYLAGAGIGRLTLVDGGAVETSNLHRQILFTADDVGGAKAVAAAARLRRQNPHVAIEARATEFTAANARALVAGHQVVLDGTDNFATRFLLHDACQSLGVPLVSAAVHRFEGTLDVFARGEGGCLHCQWPGLGAGELTQADNCAGAPVFAPAVGVLGVMQAAEVLKLLLGLGGDAARQTRLVNLLDGTSHAIARITRKGCPACGRVDDLAPAPADAADSSLFLEPADLASRRPAPQLVYLLEAGEKAPARDGLAVVAAHDLAQLRELAAAGPIALSCRHGLRSAALARLLRAEGQADVHALGGGAAATTR